MDASARRFIATLHAVAASDTASGESRIEAAALAWRIECEGEVLLSFVAPALARLRGRDGTGQPRPSGRHRGGGSSV